MRRAFAILLLAILEFPSISPALIAKLGTSLPECCRRDGAHHCASMDAAEMPAPPDGHVIEQASAKCPQFPKPGAAPVNFSPCDLSPSGIQFAPAASQPSVVEQPEARYRLSFGRAEQKRGPPALSR